MLTLNKIAYQLEDGASFTNLGVSLFAGALLQIEDTDIVRSLAVLQIVAGIVSPDTGSVFYNQVAIEDEPDSYAILMHFVGEKLAFHPRHRVQDHIKFWSRVHHQPYNIGAAIQYFRLNGLMRSPCDKLTASQQMRVALARMFACNARLWLLYHPFDRLDEEGKQLLGHLIATRVNEGGIVLFTGRSIEGLKPAILSIKDFIDEE